MSTPPIEIATVRPGLALQSLVADDGAAYARVMEANAAHLTRHGDYADVVHASAEEHGVALNEADPLHNLGIHEFGQLVHGDLLIFTVAW